MGSPEVFRLFACCVPVRGAARSTVCDLQRKTYHLVPNALYDVVTTHRDKTLEQIKEAYGPEHEATIDEYFEHLEKEELGFWTTEPERFPDLELDYERPELINNAIIDVDAESTHDFETIFRQLDDVGCNFVQLRFFVSRTRTRLETEVLAHAREGRLRGIELILKHDAGWTEEELDELCRRNNRLSTVFLYAAAEARTRTMDGTGIWICYRTDQLVSHEHCGQVHPAYFSTSYDCFLEAQGHNTCLNQKISIDARGEIKNCPSMALSWGNIRDVSLHAAVLKKGFRDLWAINKDQVEVCKDCEFRYICTDCRAFIRDPSDLYSKPSKCTYDPYLARWE
ncbi:MAG: grasp-with-spasm system SPASM domain peptide maturase [Holophagales bacterium]|nr:grasp-with-spasm system SPASM domain peptide maturase [Holophagales bacterium]